MARAPKVFSWSDGFHRYTVAATSRAKALAAWETDRDLFKEGVATETPDAPDAKAALAAPGAVIRRAEGGLKAAVETLPKSKAAPKPKADAVEARRKEELAKAEAALDAAEADQREAEADLEKRRRELDAEAAALSARWTERRAELKRAIARLRR